MKSTLFCLRYFRRAPPPPHPYCGPPPPPAPPCRVWFTHSGVRGALMGTSIWDAADRTPPGGVPSPGVSTAT